MITLKTMNKASAQRVFNQVAKHLLTQGKRAGKKGKCKYLTRTGLKCAGGCMIGKNEYKPEWESLGWYSVAIKMGVTEHRNLMEEMQSLHDCTLPSSWHRRLTNLAKIFRLSTQWIKEKK